MFHSGIDPGTQRNALPDVIRWSIYPWPNLHNMTGVLSRGSSKEIPSVNHSTKAISMYSSTKNTNKKCKIISKTKKPWSHTG